jgi:hypothetical protein
MLIKEQGIACAGPSTRTYKSYHKKQFFYFNTHHITTFSSNMNMKLHLLLLVSLFGLSSGFMAELRGPLDGEECTGEEYAEFKHCVLMGADLDSNLPGTMTELEEEAFVTQGDGRRLQAASVCGGCRRGAPRGTFCYTFCGSGRRRLEEVTDRPDVRRLEEDNIAIFQEGVYTGNDEAKQVAKVIIECLGDVSENHPCLGSTNTMTLIVHTALTSVDEMFNSAACLRGRKRHN